MLAMGHIILHLIGDYVLQSDWMASEKTKRNVPALVHAVTYSLPFLLLTTSWKAILFIAVTHFVIDRWRLARYVCWAKNFLAPRWITTERWRLEENVKGYESVRIRNHPWSKCSATGYHHSKPVWMSAWLMIIVDNCMHLICNVVAVAWL